MGHAKGSPSRLSRKTKQKGRPVPIRGTDFDPAVMARRDLLCDVQSETHASLDRVVRVGGLNTLERTEDLVDLRGWDGRSLVVYRNHHLVLRGLADFDQDTGPGSTMLYCVSDQIGHGLTHPLRVPQSRRISAGKELQVAVGKLPGDFGDGFTRNVGDIGVCAVYRHAASKPRGGEVQQVADELLHAIRT